MMNLFFYAILFLTSIEIYHFKEIVINTKIKDLLSYPRFDGIGAISGGGATSKLLVSYKEPYKSQIMDYLFKPQFGASLHLLKVEIGGDSQSTEGTEASHSHYDWDVNCFRGYEWQLIGEAKKRNPDILLYGLPWTFPGWVGNYTGNPYVIPQLLAKYIINWLKCGRNSYKFEFQYIGIWNEKNYDITYIKTLRQTLDKEGFSKVQIIANDNKWDIASDIIKDSALSGSVYGIGCHYPGTLSSDLAKKTGKPLWSSEDYSTMNTETGGACWARILNQNYVNGNMTSTIAWNLIAAYYDDLPYGRCGLMTAIEPWSGNYEVPVTIWVTAHTTQFTKPGWKYGPNEAGSGLLPAGGSYVTLFEPELKNFTIILESMTHDRSVCIRPYLPPYKVVDQNVTIRIDPTILKQFSQIYLWRTDMSSSNPAQIFHLEKTIKPDSTGVITFFLPVDNLVTISTVSNTQKGSHGSPPPASPFPAEYQDDFEKYPLHAEPDLLTPQTGSFEVVRLPTTSNVLVQTVIDQPIQWCFDKPINVIPIAVIGNFNKSNVMCSVSVLMPSYQPANSIFIGARINNSGCTQFLAGGVFFWLNFTSSQYLVTADFNAKVLYGGGSIKLAFNEWYNMTILLKDNFGWFYINDKLILESSVLYNSSPIHGFAGLGTDKFGMAYFDNLKLKTY